MYVPSPGWITGLLEMAQLPFKYVGGSFTDSCTQTRCHSMREDVPRRQVNEETYRK